MPHDDDPISAAGYTSDPAAEAVVIDVAAVAQEAAPPKTSQETSLHRKKRRFYFVGIFVLIISIILALVLGLYFGLRDDDETDGPKKKETDDKPKTDTANITTLLEAIDDAAEVDQVPTAITLPPDTTFDVADGPVFISDKAVEIKCETPGTCTFNGGGSSGIFRVDNSDVTFEGINFENAHGDDGAGALDVDDSSLGITDCNFSGSRADEVRTFRNKVSGCMTALVCRFRL